MYSKDLKRIWIAVAAGIIGGYVWSKGYQPYVIGWMVSYITLTSFRLDKID